MPPVQSTPTNFGAPLMNCLKMLEIRHDDLRPEQIHLHTHFHLVYPATGVLSLVTQQGSWIAPSNRVVWIPAGFQHQHRAHGPTDMRSCPWTPSWPEDSRRTPGSCRQRAGQGPNIGARRMLANASERCSSKTRSLRRNSRCTGPSPPMTDAGRRGFDDRHGGLLWLVEPQRVHRDLLHVGGPARFLQPRAPGAAAVLASCAWPRGRARTSGRSRRGSR